MRLILIIICFNIFISIASGQVVEDKEIARVGNVIIYESEFTERYEMTPSFYKHLKRNSTAAKLQFLYTLCAEKLWAIEAKNKNLFLKPEVNLAIKSTEKMYVRDALYKIEILDKISISESEKFNGLVKNANTLFLNFIFSKDRDAISKLDTLLNIGIPFDSILAQRPEQFEQIDPIQVGFGQMQPNVEEAVYKLNIGGYTKPLLTADGWYIFSLKNKVENVLETSDDKEEALAYVEKVIKERKEAFLYNKFMTDFFSGMQIDINGVIFEQLSKEMQDRFNFKKTHSNKTEPTDLLQIDADDVQFIENKLGFETLQNTFIKLEHRNVSLGDFIRELAFDGFTSELQFVNKIRSQLDLRVKKYIEFELLAEEGYKRGLQYLPEVMSSMKMWNDNFMQQALKADFLETDEVSDSSALKYYESLYTKSKTPAQVNIIEIYITNIDQVPIIQQKINAGEDFYTIAEEYSVRESTKSTKGEYGFFPINLHSEIGKIAYKLEVGDSFGPLQIDDGYSFFKVIGKKDSLVTLPSKSFEEVKATIKTEISQNNLFKRYIENTVEYAKQNEIVVNLENLQQAEVTTLNTFAIRHMGFGGKITAVPLLAPFTEWVEYYKKINPMIP